MKLLYCTDCSSVFNLDLFEKACVCGKTKGKYFGDAINAEYSGPCFPLGFNNYSFGPALQKQPESGLGERFEAFVIPKICPTMIRKEITEGVA